MNSKPSDGQRKLVSKTLQKVQDSNKKLLGAKGIATRSKDATRLEAITGTI